MLRPFVLIICEKIIEGLDNKISYIDCFDIINSDTLPLKFGSFVLCSQWEKLVQEDFYGRVKVSIISPTGEKKELLQDEIVIKGPKHFLNITFKDGFLFPWEGIYIIEFTITKSDGKWEEKFTMNLIVKKNSPSNAPQEA